MPKNEQQVSEQGSRSIETSYYRGNSNKKDLVKTNRAVHANSAVLRAVDHMQFNHYEATTAEVFDNDSGVLHAVLRRRMSGDIEILYKRKVKEEVSS